MFEIQDTVVQHWLLAIDRDCIAFSLSLSLHPCSKIVRNSFSYTVGKLYAFSETDISLPVLDVEE